jgi:hypothetical protein
MRVAIKLSAVFLGALALVSLAGAATVTPSVAGMTLAPADVPGAKVVSQGKLAKGGYLSAYQRTLKFATPYGRSQLVGVRSQGMLAKTPKQVTTDLAVIQRVFNTPQGRKGFVAGIASGFKVKPTDVKLSRVRHPAIGDGTIEQPLSVAVNGTSNYESLLYMRLDRVLVQFVFVGGRPVAQADSVKLAKIAQAHVTSQLTPVDVTPPAITGTADLGQTLTVTPGTWSNTDVKLAYQWQRCDATGANCADIAGSTTDSYSVADTDAGSTFRVVETATDRFGTPSATSAVTAAVPVPPPPPPADTP